MVMVSVTDLQERLSEYLDRAKAGEEVVVTEDGKPVVEMRPVEASEMSEEHKRERARLERMAEQGLVKLGTGKIPKEVWQMPRPSVPGNAALEALRADRDEGW